ncbi:MAG: hypothetical protein QXW77_04045 [Candidatus Hadarchaeales archaeon]
MERESNTQPEDPFTLFLGRLVKVVYVDGAQEVKVRKGQLVRASSDFIVIRTRIRSYLVPKRQVTELRGLEEGEVEP